MAPKNKAKKGKKQDDDEFWEKKAGTSAGVSLNGSAIPSDDEGSAPFAKAKGGIAGFAALGMSEEDAAAAAEEEEQDFGGLMSVIKATSAKPKKEKKKAKKQTLDDEDPANGDEGADQKTKAPVEMTAEELADEEWGLPDKKGKKKKEKKGKKGKGQAADDDVDDILNQAIAAASPAADADKGQAPVEMTAEELADEEWGATDKKGKKKGKGKKEEKDEAPAAPAENGEEEADGDAAGDDAGTKVLSKKEKEKLKKEREKAKKKAQAAAKKAASGDAAEEKDTAQAAPVEASADAKEGEDESEGEEEAGGGGGAASKKKKKKKGAKKEEKEAPAKKKAPGALGALKALMEEKKRIEEEQRRAEEEERKRIEEEERKAEEEAKRKEEEKQRRKEKEKAKREQAKKEGRLLTKKQKEEARAAEIRKQALLASGVQIEGLQQQGSGPPAKKVVYGNRKKQQKGPQAKGASPTPSSIPATPVSQAVSLPEPEEEKVEKKEEKKEAEDDLKSDWDASSGDEKKADKAEEDVKSDWDASSDDEEKVASKAAAKTPPAAKTNGTAAPKKLETKAETQPTPAAAPKPATLAKAPAPSQAKAAPAKKPEPESESDSEDESSEEDSDDSSEDDSSDEETSSDEEEQMTQAERMAAKRKAEAAERRAKAHEAALASRNKDELRSPICCILGHVDTGKTKLLDKIRQTNVQEGEAGGITQQIGATYFPVDAIKQKTTVLNKDGSFDYKIPGLLVIDTPGHESFTNLRSRGSSLCNIAILVVDIMHGLEPQTLESLRLLRDRKTPFIVALNKIDRMYGWEAIPNNAFQDSLAKQKKSVQREFEDRVAKTITAFAEQGLNAVLYYDNKNFGRNVSLVPTSAITGEGVPDMIMLLVNLTQQRMSERLMYISSLECTVLEVKVIEGLGTTIDVVLVNGYLREGDKIVVCGLNGPIVTQIRALLTPQPLRELRIKSAYVHHKEVKAALGVKISAPDLEKAIAGSRLLVCGPDDDEDDLKDEVMGDLTNLLSSIDKSGRGVCVQASTLGSLEALLDFLKVSKIPVSGINIGPVHKKDVMRAATMLEKAKELACMLCFDVPVDRDAERLAEELGIKIFKADIIYHLFDAFTAYNAEIMEAKRRDAAPQAIWPCRLKTIAAFCKRDPIILGVDILDGTLRVGTPLCVVKVDPTTQKREIIDLGKITSLEINHKAHDMVKKSQAGGGVAVKIEHAVYQSAKMFGRHFDEKDEIVSHITRASIDVLKATFKADVTTEEWLLIKALKPRLGIQ